QALAAARADAAGSTRRVVGEREELGAAALDVAPRPTLRAGGAARRVRGNRVRARAGAGAAGGAGPGDRGPRGDGAVSGPRRVAALLPRHRHAVGDGAPGRDRGLPTLPPASGAHGLLRAGAEHGLLRPAPPPA